MSSATSDLSRKCHRAHGDGTRRAQAQGSVFYKDTGVSAPAAHFTRHTWRGTELQQTNPLNWVIKAETELSKEWFKLWAWGEVTRWTKGLSPHCSFHSYVEGRHLWGRPARLQTKQMVFSLHIWIYDPQYIFIHSNKCFIKAIPIIIALCQAMPWESKR